LTQNDGWNKIQLTEATIQKHLKVLLSHPEFAERLRTLFERKKDYPAVNDPDFQIYDGFVGDEDKTKMRVVRAADQDSLADANLAFSDERLEQLLPRYKARNFPQSITASEREIWEKYRTNRILKGLNGQLSLEQFAKRLAELSAVKAGDDQAQFLLQELQLYAESIAPIPD